MSKKYFLLCMTLILAVFIILTKQAFAKIVRYVDIYGKVHYVNTKYSKVPQRYRDQIEDADVEDNTADSNDKQDKEDLSSDNFNGMYSAGKRSIPVEVFTQADCESCRKLKILLRTFRITYREYNVDDTDYGKEVYKVLGGELPITKIGGKLFRGFKIKKIQQEVKRLKEQE